MNGTNSFLPLGRDRSDFVPLGRKQPQRPCLDRIEARTAYHIFGAEDGFEVAVPVAVLERLAAFARKSDPDEWYGLVCARECEDADGPHAVVVGVVPDLEVDAGPAHIRTTHDSEYRTRTLARSLFPDAEVVGWAHSHPRLGVFFSGTDKENQATWRHPNSLGIVVDPWSAEGIMVFRGPESEPMRPQLPRAVRVSCDPTEVDRHPPFIEPPAPAEAREVLPRPGGSEPKRPASRFKTRAFVIAALSALVGVLIAVAAGRLWVRIGRLESRVSSLEQSSRPETTPAAPTATHDQAHHAEAAFGAVDELRGR